MNRKPKAAWRDKGHTAKEFGSGLPHAERLKQNLNSSSITHNGGLWILLNFHQLLGEQCSPRVANAPCPSHLLPTPHFPPREVRSQWASWEEAEPPCGGRAGVLAVFVTCGPPACWKQEAWSASGRSLKWRLLPETEQC